MLATTTTTLLARIIFLSTSLLSSSAFLPRSPSAIFSVSTTHTSVVVVAAAAAESSSSSAASASASASSAESAMTQQKYKTLLLDMDGVLAEVSKSYRAAIILTTHEYGATSVTDELVTEWKVRGNANCDWTLSRDMILADPNGQKDVTLQQVTDTFEGFYQGTPEKPGLYKLETLIPTRELLLEFRKRSKAGMGIVTGRPRSDCLKFLRDLELEELFDYHYCSEDGPKKPDAFPVQRVCEQLGIKPDKSVVLVGDTPDDIRAAVNAGCSGVGVTTPEAAAACAAQGKDHTEAPLSLAMKECGADMILPPGFAELIQYFEE